MKRKITELEQKLLDNGWYLANKRYTGKRSEKTLCYEYHKTADLRHNETKFDQFIRLDVKREKVVKYGIANVNLEELDNETLTFVHALFILLRDNVVRLTKPKTDLEKAKELVKEGMTPIDIFGEEENETNEYLGSMTPEQMDELDRDRKVEN